MSNSTDYFSVLCIDILTICKSSVLNAAFLVADDAVGADYSFSLWPINRFFRVFKCFISFLGGFITFYSCHLDILPFFKLFYLLLFITLVKLSLFSLELPPNLFEPSNNLLWRLSYLNYSLTLDSALVLDVLENELLLFSVFLSLT